MKIEIKITVDIGRFRLCADLVIVELLV